MATIQARKTILRKEIEERIKKLTSNEKNLQSEIVREKVIFCSIS